MNNTSLVIKNLPKNTKEVEISNIFSKYGNINGINLKKNNFFITFNNSFDANNAQKSFNNKSFNGNNLIIEKLSNEDNNNFSSNLFTLIIWGDFLSSISFIRGDIVLFQCI